MPVVNPIIVSVLPDDRKCIRSHGNYITDPCGQGVTQLDIEHFRVRFGPHVLMSASAGGAGTSRTQQLKWIDARVIVVPCDREFSGLLIGSDAGRFFVHKSLSLKVESTTPVVGTATS
jgi:hypothetical protein